MMKFLQFEQCIDLLKTPIEQLSPGHPQHSPLLGTAEIIADFYIEPFTMELEEELLSKNSQEQKTDLIKWYVSRLMKSKNHRPINDIQSDSEAKITIVEVNDNGRALTRIGDMLIADIPYNPNNDSKFGRGCNILYHLLFDEMQKCCITFNLSFITFCRELNFDLETIDFKISLAHTKPEKIQVSEKLPETKLLKIIAPTFTPESVPRIFEILKDFFSLQHQPELLKLLQNGENAAEPLLFMDSGNRLADAFKQLYECGFIKGCKKIELENWIGKNFLFRKGDLEIQFQPKYLNNIISSNEYQCKSPVLNLFRDKVTGDYLISKL